MPVTSLSEEEGWEVVRDMYSTILPSLGASSKFPTVLRWASNTYLGLGMPHPFIEQGIEQIKMILGHMSQPQTPTGQLLEISLEQAQVELGLPTPLWQADYKKHNKLITETWVKSVWKFVSKFGIKLNTAETVRLPKLRENDRYIMEIAEGEGFTDQERISINRC